MKMKHMRLGEHLLKFGILYLLVLLLLGTSLISDNILTSSNLINVIRQASMLIIISLGEGMVIVSSGIDLSVGSIAAYTGVFSAGAMVYWGWPIPVAIIATVLLCTIIGLLNGIIVAKAGIQPMIATLATMNAVKGMAMLYADGGQVVGLSADFTKLGRGYLLEVIPIPVVFMVVVSLIIFFVMTKTTFGKYLYAIGGSEEVARLAGINVVSTKIAAYGISSMLAAIAGVLPEHGRPDHWRLLPHGCNRVCRLGRNQPEWRQRGHTWCGCRRIVYHRSGQLHEHYRYQFVLAARV